MFSLSWLIYKHSRGWWTHTSCHMQHGSPSSSPFVNPSPSESFSQSSRVQQSSSYSKSLTVCCIVLCSVAIINQWDCTCRPFSLIESNILTEHLRKLHAYGIWYPTVFWKRKFVPVFDYKDCWHQFWTILQGYGPDSVFRALSGSVIDVSQQQRISWCHCWTTGINPPRIRVSDSICEPTETRKGVSDSSNYCKTWPFLRVFSTRCGLYPIFKLALSPLLLNVLPSRSGIRLTTSTEDAWLSKTACCGNVPSESFWHHWYWFFCRNVFWPKYVLTVSDVVQSARD